MKRKMVFALLLAGVSFLAPSIADAQATCTAGCPGGSSVSCSGSDCSATSGDGVMCKVNGQWWSRSCPRVAADW